MGHKEKKIATGIVRRLRIFGNVHSSRTNPRSREIDQTFSSRYLSHLSNGRKKFDPEVATIRQALSFANVLGKSAALEFIELIEPDYSINRDLVHQLLDSRRSSPEPSNIKHHFADFSLFNIDLVSCDRSKIRECYTAEFRKAGIELPLSKHEMIKIDALLSGGKSTRTVGSLDQLKKLTQSFLTNSWPLFSPATYSVLMGYFDFHQKFSLPEIEAHFELLYSFGFEKLHLRLLVLRAVNGDDESRRFVEALPEWNGAQFDPPSELIIRNFITHRTKLNTVSAHSSGTNPLERMIFLCIYIFSHSGSSDFIKRLIEAYEIDTSIITVLNWENFSQQIDDSRLFRSPELIFLAASLRQRSVVSNFEFVRSQYGAGGAGADLINVAMHFRNQNQKSRTLRNQFLRNFLKLPANSLRLVFEFLLDPGMLDRIANVFPSDNPSVVGADRNIDLALLALETRLACLNAIRSKRLFPNQVVATWISDTRKAMRQVRYNNGSHHGKIRLHHTDLAREISLWRTQIAEFFDNKSRSTDSTFNVSNAAAQAKLLAEDLSSLLCFRGRYGLDLLLADNLRHFFLEARMASSLDDNSGVGSVPEPALSTIKFDLGEVIEDFCKNWITISDRGNFYTEIASALSKLTHQELTIATKPARPFEDECADIVIAKFSQFLERCKIAWNELFRPKVEHVVVARLTELSVAPLVVDAIKLNLENAFDETSKWMSINQNSLPARFLLKELISFEAMYLKSSREFRRLFTIELHDPIRGPGELRSTWDIELPSIWIEPVVSLIDNLVDNACKYSGLGERTRVTVQVSAAHRHLAISVTNNVNSENTQEIKNSVPEIRANLARPPDEKKLLKKGGTGLFRVRYNCEKILGNNFRLEVLDSGLNRGSITFRGTFSNVPYEFVNVQ